eukprot:TRINITY_DN12198_c0_g1_i1.p1 TRINITY_DN12198_c0_g1~~TRINITY_DN12198_c0_g1_i1.p1  ORF type:complete len:324 (+),score=60.93 TRINITY_DN12198_c0_g1_i1:57-1028(+)
MSQVHQEFEDESHSEDETEDSPGVSQNVLVGIAVGVFFLAQVLVGYHLEGWDLMTSTYFTTQVFTTIGYGDIVPVHAGTRLFTCLYVFLCLIFIAYFLNTLITRVTDSQQQFMEQAITSAGNTQRSLESAEQKKIKQARNKWLASSAALACLLIFGTVFYAEYENCSCSYGDLAVAGCNATSFDTCSNTEGQVKDYVGAFYMSVITLTTVGFGDLYPMSYVGQLVGIFWMAIGVATCANWVLATQDLMFNVQQSQKRKKGHDDVLFDEMDGDSDGILQKDEYLSYMILTHGTHSKEAINKFRTDFDSLTSGGQSGVSYEQIHG